MPFIEQTALAPAGMVPQSEFELDVTAPAAPASEIFKAAFRRENSIASTALAISGGPMSPPDPTFDPWASIGGYEDFAASFIDANSPEDVARIKARIDGERRRADVLASGGALALAAEVTAGLADPINLIPVGGQIIAVGRAGTRMAQGAVRLGTAGAVGAAAQEAVLQATQETRTGAESAVNIASAALLTGILGGAVAGYAGRDLQAIAAKIMGETERIADDMAANVPGGGRNLSAAARRTGDAVLFGRMLDLADNPEAFKSAQDGIAARYGLTEVGAGASYTASGRRADDGSGMQSRYYKAADGVEVRISNHSAVNTGGQLVDVDIILGPDGAQIIGYARSNKLKKPVVYKADLQIADDIGEEIYEGTIFKGFGGDAAKFSQAVDDAIAEAIDAHAATKAASASTGTVIGGGNLSAASAAGRTMETEAIARLGGLEKALAKTSPTLRTQTSPALATRVLAQELAEQPLQTKGNLAGIASPVAAEAFIRQYQYPLAKALTQTDDLFVRYRTGKEGGMGTLARIGIGDVFGRTEGKLTYNQFMEEVGKAMRRGDTHAVPEVAEAAKAMRREVFDPLKDAAVRQGLLPDDVDPGTSATYLMRLYNHEKIAANRNEFTSILTDWYAEQQAKKADIQPRVQALLDERARIEADAARRGDVLGDDMAAKMADLERRLEDAVLEWEGKATRGARRAVDARTDTAGSGAAARAILDAAEAIAKVNTRLERMELQDVARQTVDRILSTPAGRLPYDQPTSGARVPLRDETPDLRARALKGRVLMIPDERIEAFLENDAGVVARSYVRTMAPDVVLAERGWLNFKEKISGITEEYERLRQGVTDPKELTRLQKRMDADIRDVEAIYNRLRGTYALPDNPQGLVVRAGRVARDLNYLRLLGGMTLSAIPDMGRAVMVHGFGRVFRDGLAPLVKNMGAVRLAAEEVKLSGTALDMVLDTRAMAMADIMDDYGRYSKFERGMQAATSRFGVVTMMAPWNAAMKQFVGIVSQTRSLQAIEAMASGKIAPAERARLAQFGIDEEMAGRIGKEWKSHGQKQDGIWWANTEAWTDRGAAETYRAALAKEVDMAVVTPGQEKPLWMSTELGKVIGQFRSFFMSSMQRVTMAGIQKRDMATMQGATLMLGLGAMVYYLRTDSQRLSDDPAVWLREAVDRSGLTGWAFEINNMTEKMTRGAVGVSALTGGPTMSRYASRGVLESLLGPTTGIVNDLAQITGAAATGEWTEADTRAARRMFPYQNLLGLKQAIDATEAGVNEALGIPMRVR